MGCGQSSPNPNHARSSGHSSQVFDISDQNLSTMPDMTASVSPKKFIAHGNMLSRFPKVVRPYLSVVEIDLSDNRFTRIPMAFGGLPHLQTLRFANNPLSRSGAFDVMSELRHLTSLDVSSCGLKVIGVQVFSAHALTALDVSCNAGLDLKAAQFANLPRLSSFAARDCELLHLGRLAGAKTIQHLDISGNRRVDLREADAMGSLAETVTELLCDQMVWHVVPRGILAMTAVVTLRLRRNPFQSLEGLEGLEELQTVDLSACSLAVVPEHAESMMQLTALILSDNPALPQSLPPLAADSRARRIIVH
jgi:Leucine-rich repeat (LRR) protein